MFDLEALATGNLEPAGIEAEKLEDRGVNVGNVMAVLDGVEPELVGGTVDDAALDPSTRQPHGEAVVMVVATVGSLPARSPAELGRPDDDRVVEQPPPFEIDQQSRDRPVRPARKAWNDWRGGPHGRPRRRRLPHREKPG